jgi:hypothetical protein
VVNLQNLNWISVIIPMTSLFLTFLEITILQVYENVYINLEMRSKLRSHTRLGDNFKVGMLSVLFATLAVLLGVYAFGE